MSAEENTAAAVEIKTPVEAGKDSGPDAGEAANGNAAQEPVAGPSELGGPKGPEPTRFGDWERAGRCSDF